MGIVNMESLEMTGEKSVTVAGKYRFEYDHGTVEVTLERATRRVPCKRSSNGTLYVNGISGRYRTGTQAWPASVSVDERGEFIHFGRDERAGRCIKSMLFFDDWQTA